MYLKVICWFSFIMADKATGKLKKDIKITVNLSNSSRIDPCKR
jgi:hypothetical protein